ncbi:MAG TPA: hypothetical protein VID51_01885 [Solirubrobacterales bacterium]|jgi:hypothetical protein
MRLAKAVFPTAIIAVVAFGVCGAASAMAQTSTALCEVHQEPCEQKNLMTETHYQLPAGKVYTMKSATMTILCLEMLYKETVAGLATAPKPLKFTTTKLTFDKCGTTAAHNNCTVTTLILPEEHFLRTDLNKATGKVLAGRVISECDFAFGKVVCAYDETGVELELEYNESEEAEGDIESVEEEEVELTEGSELCPKTATLDFEAVSLQPGYIVT